MPINMFIKMIESVDFIRFVCSGKFAAYVGMTPTPIDSEKNASPRACKITSGVIALKFGTNKNLAAFTKPSPMLSA